MLTIKYKGRRFSSGQALANVIKRDAEEALERQVRQAAGATGASVRKTARGLEVSGDATKMARFYRRLGQ